EKSHEICLSVEEGFDQSNSVMYFVSSNGKTLAPLGLNAERSEFCSGSYKFAENSGIKFVLISYREDGKHYFAQMDITAGNQDMPKAEPKVLPLEDIVSMLRRL